MSSAAEYLALGQDGLISRRQAVAAGMTEAALAHKLRPGGPWQRLLPGVYAIFTGTPTRNQRMRAALLFAGQDAMLTGPSALALQGFRYGESDAPVHVLIPHSCRRSSSGFVILHWTRRLPPAWSRKGVPTAPTDRAVADTCRSLESLREVRAVVAEAVQRRRVSVDQLSHEAMAGPRRGRRLLRIALAEVEAGVRSVPEAECRLLLRGSALPEPLFNPDLYDPQGRWVARPDAWFEEAGLALEIDSVEWHLSPEQWEATMRRHDRMGALGVTVLHVTPRRLRKDARNVLTELEAAYATGTARPGCRATAVRPDKRIPAARHA